MARLTIPRPETIENAAGVAEKTGLGFGYSLDGALVLVAKGKTGRLLYPIIRAAIDVVEGRVK